MSAPLEGVRVIDCSLLAPGATAAHLADLGAEVLKVEAPGGDYVRELTWPIIEGSSLMHHQVSRGKKSLVLDLRREEGVAVFKDLVAGTSINQISGRFHVSLAEMIAAVCDEIRQSTGLSLVVLSGGHACMRSLPIVVNTFLPDTPWGFTGKWMKVVNRHFI